MMYFERIKNSFLFANDYTRLRKENRLRFQCLKPEDQQVLEPIYRRLRHRYLSDYGNELIFKDLIGLALEAEQQGQTLADFKVENSKTFFAQLEQEAEYLHFWEICLSLISFLLACFSANSLLRLLMEPGSTYQLNRLSLIGFFTSAGVIVLFSLILGYAQRRLHSDHSAANVQLRLVFFFVWALAVVGFYKLRTVYPAGLEAIALVPNGLMLAVWLLLWVGTRYVQMLYYKKRAAQKPWVG